MRNLTIRAFLLGAFLLAGVEPYPPPGECQEGVPGCLCDGINGECRDAPEYATTCAECVTEEECDNLCGVGPCDSCDQSGCWIPEGLKCDLSGK